MIGAASDYLENKLLDHVFSATSFTPPATLYVALFTATPSDSGGGTEVTGGSYARVSVTNNLTNFPAASGGAKSNGTAISFVPATADWGNCVAFGIFDASSGGNLITWAWLTDNPEIANIGTAAATGDLFTAYAHGLANGNQIVFFAPPGGQLPTGITANTAYYVVGSTTNTFQVSATSGGAAIDITTDGGWYAIKIKNVQVNNGDTAVFSAGSLNLSVS